MNNRSWMKIQFSLFNDPRLATLGRKVGVHEATSIYLRLLWLLYDVYEGMIDWQDEDVRDSVCAACATDEVTIEKIVENGVKPSIGFFSFTAWETLKKIHSEGVSKELESAKSASSAGKKGGRPTTAKAPHKTPSEG